MAKIEPTTRERYEDLIRLYVTSVFGDLRVAAGVDIRTVAGRLGHGSGGATTLRIYRRTPDRGGRRRRGGDIRSASAPRTYPDRARHAAGPVAGIHDRCAMVDATRWAEYRAGLDELDSELARITEHHDPEDLDDLLYSHLTRLELDGWRARATHVAGADEPVSASLDLITYAHRQLDSQHNGTGLPRGDLERIMDAIRDSVPRTGGNAAPPEAQRRRGAEADSVCRGASVATAIRCSLVA